MPPQLSNEVRKYLPIFRVLADEGSHPPVALDRPVCVIGRGDVSVNLPLHSPQVSKLHALVVRDQRRVYLRDLASTNGVQRNGMAVQEVGLSDEDVIRIGSYTLRCDSGFSRQREPSPDSPAAGGGQDTLPPAELRGDGIAFTFPAGQNTVLIGRRSACDLQLDDDSVAPVHAIVFQLDGKRYVRDLGTPRGTYLNGRSIHQEELNPDDQLKVGNILLNYSLLEPQAEPVDPLDISAALPPPEPDLESLDEVEALIEPATQLEPEPEPEPEPIAPSESAIPVEVESAEDSAAPIQPQLADDFESPIEPQSSAEPTLEAVEPEPRAAAVMLAATPDAKLDTKLDTTSEADDLKPEPEPEAQPEPEPEPELSVPEPQLTADEPADVGMNPEVSLEDSRAPGTPDVALHDSGLLEPEPAVDPSFHGEVVSFADDVEPAPVSPAPAPAAIPPPAGVIALGDDVLLQPIVAEATPEQLATIHPSPLDHIATGDGDTGRTLLASQGDDVAQRGTDAKADVTPREITRLVGEVADKAKTLREAWKGYQGEQPAQGDKQADR